MAAYTTYCDLGFLDRFYRERPTGDVLEFSNTDRVWLTAHAYLRQETNLIVQDAEPESLLQYPFLRYLMDRPAGTRCRFGTGEGERDESECSPWTMFMFNSEPDDVGLSVWHITPDNWRDQFQRLGAHCLLDICDQAGDRPRLQAWSDLTHFHAPLSAIVICDRYMLSDLKKARENVFELVANLLPKTPTRHPIDVTLVTHEVKEPKLETVWNALNEHIHDRKPEQPVNLTILKAINLSDYHDRHVFVDYGFLYSGHTLNYFSGGKPALTTTLTFEPALRRTNLELMHTRLRELERIVRKTPEKLGLYKNVVGDRRNRLLEAVRELEESPEPAS